MRYGGSSIRIREAVKPWALPRRLGTRHCIQTHSYGTYVDTSLSLLNRMMFTFNVTRDCFFFDSNPCFDFVMVLLLFVFTFIVGFYDFAYGKLR